MSGGGATRSGPTSAGRDDDGVSLVELMVAMAVFLVALTLILPTYLVLNSSASATQAMSVEDTVAVPALRQLAAEVANATSISATGAAVVLYTATSTGATECAQWQVSGGSLQDRTWPPGSTTAVAFSPAFSGLSVTNASPFSVSAQNPDTLDVDLMLLANGAKGSGRELSTAYSAQGITGSGATSCSPAPQT